MIEREEFRRSVLLKCCRITAGHKGMRTAGVRSLIVCDEQLEKVTV